MTQTLLRIDASPRGQNSVSRTLADQVVTQIAPNSTITRDLTHAIPQLDETWIAANFTGVDQRSSEQFQTLALSDTLVSELQSADTILIATPIYNFGIPASLKAWVDHIARAGVTFRYTETGPQGLLSGKKAILVVTSGGTEVDSDIDFATPYLRHVLGFIGIHDVQIVRNDKQMVDADASNARAQADLSQLAA